MLSQNERTLRMKEEYIALHDQGLSPKQIAHHFDLDTKTVYNHLQEIAENAGVTRESLLVIPRSKHVTHERRFEPVAPVDLSNFQQTEESFNHTLHTIETQIHVSEQTAQRFMEEEAQW